MDAGQQEAGAANGKRVSRRFSPLLEQQYQSELASEKLRLTKLMVGTAATVVLLFSVIDYWALPSAYGKSLAIRGASFALLGACFALCFWDKFQSHYSSIVFTMLAGLGISVNALIYVSAPGELAHEVYFVGLILVSLAASTFTFASTQALIGVSAISIVSYVFVASAHHQYLHSISLAHLLVNVSFVFSASIVGLISHRLRDDFARENYLLRHSLERDVELREAESRLANHMASHDTLTGLPNRRHFQEVAAEMLAQADARNSELALVFVDLNDFKPINDQHGHSAGDRTLTIIGHRMRTAMPEQALVARIGGDEFVAALPVTEQVDIELAIAQIASTICKPIEVRGTHIQVTASVGTASFPSDGTNLSSLMNLADQRMYAQKSRRKEQAPPAASAPINWDGARA